MLTHRKMVTFNAKESGKMFGDPCPHCVQGILQAVLHRYHVGGELRISHLACSACAVIYEAKDREKTLSNLRDEQLETFINPETEPTGCIFGCEGKLWAGPVFDIEIEKPNYWYCGTCNAVAWKNS